jgi:hypothetical protein
MADFASINLYAFIASFAAYIAILVKRHYSNDSEKIRLNQLEKIAQYFSAEQSLEKAIRQLVSEQPASTPNYAKIIEKVDNKIDFESAVSKTADESGDDFFSKICLMLISVNRKKDANLLYNSVQKIREVSGLQSFKDSKSEIASWTVQVVCCLVMPFTYFFMISTLGFAADIYLNGFLALIVVSSAIFQGVVFKQWAAALVKIPLLFSVFYLLYFVIAPKFFSSLAGGIV